MSAVLEMVQSELTDLADLRTRFAAARQGGLRAKDAAEKLGLSEGAAIAAHAGAGGALQATALRSEWLHILQGLEACGPVMALTRNATVVHEKTGVYQNISATGHMGLALGEAIDLRLFFSRWHAGFFVFEPAKNSTNPPSQSLQFFDAHGVAVHKVFVRPQTDLEAFSDIVNQFADASQACTFTPAPTKKAADPDAAKDAEGLAQGWTEMTDTHQFFGLINRFGVERQQAMRIAAAVLIVSGLVMMKLASH